MKKHVARFKIGGREFLAILLNLTALSITVSTGSKVTPTWKVWSMFSQPKRELGTMTPPKHFWFSCEDAQGQCTVPGCGATGDLLPPDSCEQIVMDVVPDIDGAPLLSECVDSFNKWSSFLNGLEDGAKPSLYTE